MTEAFREIFGKRAVDIEALQERPFGDGFKPLSLVNVHFSDGTTEVIKGRSVRDIFAGEEEKVTRQYHLTVADREGKELFRGLVAKYLNDSSPS